MMDNNLLIRLLRLELILVAKGIVSHDELDKAEAEATKMVEERQRYSDTREDLSRAMARLKELVQP